MKKLIIILASLIILSLCFVVFFAIPYSFHNGIHKEAIAKRFLDSQTQYTDISFHEKSSIVALSTTSQLKVRSVSFINPFDNYVNVDYIDTSIDLALNFQIYLHMRGFSEVAIEIKFSDEDFSRDGNHIKLEDLSIFIEKFNLGDLSHLSSQRFQNALEDKKIFVELADASYKIDALSGEIENLDIKVGNSIDGEDLTFEFSTDIEKIINEGLAEKLNLTASKINLSLSSFDKNLALEFITTIPAKSIKRRGPPSIFEVLPYIQAIRYPLEFKLRANTLDGGEKTYLNLDAGLTSQKFLSLSSYTAVLDFQNKAQATAYLLKEAILYSYSKGSARNYVLSPGLPPEKKFMQRDEVRAKIKSLLRDSLVDRNQVIISSALDMGLINKSNNLYSTQIELKNGDVFVNKTRYSLKEAMGLPVKLLERIYSSANEDISNTLISGGLHPSSI